jgi:hypothetical protein
MALYLAIALARMAQVPSSHNLWLIEFLMFGVMALPGMVDGFVASQKRTLLNWATTWKRFT